MQLAPSGPSYRHSHPDDAWTPVLVAVVNNERDLLLAQDQHWYRIPVGRAPRQIAAEYLALYQTSAFGVQGQRINYFAPILRYHLLTRADLLPDEPDHSRAAEQYFKIELGELQPLPKPVPSVHQARITFIYTTLERLLQANDVSDLWLRAVARQKLYAAIHERGLAVECWYPVDMGDRPEADLALFGPGGRLNIYIDEPSWEDLDEPRPAYQATTGVYHMDALALLRDPDGMLDQLDVSTRMTPPEA